MYVIPLKKERHRCSKLLSCVVTAVPCPAKLESSWGRKLGEVVGIYVSIAQVL